MKKSSIILHIPHSSIKLPDEYLVSLVNKDFIESELKQSTDLYTDIIYSSNGIEKLIFPYSRLYIDVERFTENDEMEKYGRGLFYTKTYDNKPINYKSTDYRINALETYKEHHKSLETLVDKALEHYEKCLIIDCHSFNENSLFFDRQGKSRPDICLGTTQDNTPDHLYEIFENNFSKEYIVDRNYPYSDSMIPLKHFKNKNVYTIMVEVNKKLYLKNDFTLNKNGKAIFNKIFHNILDELTESFLY